MLNGVARVADAWGKLKFCAPPPPTNFFPKNNEMTSIVEYNRISVHIRLLS